MRPHRPQLYLDEAIHRRLQVLARRQGRTLSELVRDALTQTYGKPHATSKRPPCGPSRDYGRSRRHRRQHRLREAAPPRYASSAPAALTGVLLDSDVIIDVLRGRTATIAAVRRLAADGISTYCRAVSWAEIFAGVRPGEETRTEAFFAARARSRSMPSPVVGRARIRRGTRHLTESRSPTP